MCFANGVVGGGVDEGLALVGEEVDLVGVDVVLELVGGVFAGEGVGVVVVGEEKESGVEAGV